MSRCCCGSAYKTELVRLLKLSGPLTIGSIASTVMLATDLGFVGHLSTEALAGISLSSAVINATLVFSGSMVDALRVLVSQAIGAAHADHEFDFCPCLRKSHAKHQKLIEQVDDDTEDDDEAEAVAGGSQLPTQSADPKRMKLVGIWIQSALFLVIIVTLMTSVIWLWAGDIVCSFTGGSAARNALLDEQQLSEFRNVTVSIMPPASSASSEVCNLANVYGRWSILWLWPLKFIGMGRTLLESLEITLPQTLVNLIFTATNFGTDQLFINTLGLGFVGSPVATAVGSLLQLAVYWLLFVRLAKLHRGYWGGWTRQAVHCKRLLRFLRVAVPMMATAAMYEFVFDVQILLAESLLPSAVAAEADVHAAAFNATVNLGFLLQSIFLGLSIALTIRVATELGNGDVAGTKRVIGVSMQLGMGLSLCVALATVLLRHQLGFIYSDDPAVVRLVADVLPISVVYFVLTTLSLFLQAILEGQARPQFVTLATFLGSWVVGMPLSVLLTVYTDWGLQGLWAGSIVGELVKCCISGLVVFRVSWPDQVRRVQQQQQLDDDRDNEQLQRELNQLS